jgi:hypothetical protein
MPESIKFTRERIMFKFSVLLTFFCVLMCSCAQQQTSYSPQESSPAAASDPNLTSQDYALITDFLSQQKKLPGTNFVIKSRIEPAQHGSTKPSDMAASLKKILGVNVESSLANSLFERNQTAGTVEPKFGSTVKVTVLPLSDYKVLFDSPNPWRRFYSRFPHAAGLMTVSRPGYSKDGIHALFAYTLLEDAKNGQAYIVLLRKVNNKWVVERSQVTAKIKSAG